MHWQERKDFLLLIKNPAIFADYILIWLEIVDIEDQDEDHMEDNIVDIDHHIVDVIIEGVATKKTAILVVVAIQEIIEGEEAIPEGAVATPEMVIGHIKIVHMMIEEEKEHLEIAVIILEILEAIIEVSQARREVFQENN